MKRKLLSTLFILLVSASQAFAEPVDTTATQTLTNKTLTSPIITTPTINGTISGTGAILSNGSTTARTLTDRFAEQVNVKDYGAVGDGVTSDQTAVAAAVAAAVADGREMFWPAGTYLTTASISNFHDVRHLGPGVLKRGSTLFYIMQQSSSTPNALFVATTGNDANDGITATEPLRNIQKSLDILNLWKPLRFGWTVWIAAGTYEEAASLKSGVSFNDDYLTIRGPVPSIGTASGATTNAAGYATGIATMTLASAGTGTLLVGDTITFAGDATLYRVSGGDTDVSNGGSVSIYPALQTAIPESATAITVVTTNRSLPTVFIDYPGSGIVGLDINQHNKVKVQDIKFTDWLSPAVTGVNADLGSVLWTYNVHTSYCRQGIVANSSQLFVQGGILHGVDWTTGGFPAGGGMVGVVAYAGTVASIGYGGTSDATGTIIENFTQAGYEGKSNTHVVSSWVTYQSNEVAVWIYSNSRFDDRHNIYKKNELVFKNVKGFVSRDSVLGLSEYNLGKTYTQAPSALGIGNFEIFNMFSGATEEIFMHPNAIVGMDITKQRQSTTVSTKVAVSSKVDAAQYLVGVITVNLAVAGTGTIDVNDVITFAGQTTRYTVTAGDTDVSNGGAISFTPALVTQINAAASPAITIQRPFRTLATIYGGTLQSGTGTNGKYLEVFLVGTATGSTASKTVILSLGGTTVTTLTIPSGTQTWSARVTIWASNTTSVIQTSEVVGATVTAARASVATVDAWADNPLTVFVTALGSGDTVLLHECRVIKWG
jgi:hypothetical protein